MSYQQNKFTEIANAIRVKSGKTGTIIANNFPQEILNIPSGGGGGSGNIVIKFLYIDQSTGLYKTLEKRCNKGESVTFPDAVNISAVQNICPSLAFTGWNFTNAELTNIQNNMTVGATYAPTDNKTHFFIEVTKTTGSSPRDAFAQTIYLNKNGTGNLYINWGENTTVDTITTNGNFNKSHTYTNYGKYEVTVWTDGNIYGFGNGSTSAIVFGGNIQAKRNILKYAYISNINVTNIRSVAFQNCHSLTSIIIPNGITNIGNNSFQLCYSLTSITIPNGVTNIGSSIFYNCHSLAAIAIPNSITNIGNNSFQLCYSLTSITIPNGVTNIGSVTFQNCYSLTSITIPNGITHINGNAFQGLVSLTSIAIPNSVTNIGDSAFAKCYPMLFYKIEGENVKLLTNTNAFTDINTTAKIYVLDSLVASYKTATNWATYANYIYPMSQYPN